MAPDREDLFKRLTLALAAGRAEPGYAVPALRALAAGQMAPSRVSLVESLEAAALAELGPLLDSLKAQLVRDAQRHHQLRRAGQEAPPELAEALAGLPLDVTVGAEGRVALPPRLREALLLLRDRLFVEPRRVSVPLLAARVDEAYRRAVARLLEEPPSSALVLGRLVAEARRRLPVTPDATAALDVVAALAAEADGAAELGTTVERFRNAAPGERERLLDVLLTSPNEAALSRIPALAQEPWAQRRACLVLTLRFGTSHGFDWLAWRRWLERPRAEGLAAPDDAPLLLLLWYSARADADPAVVARLETACAATHAARAGDIAERWAASVSADERRALLDLGRLPARRTEPPPPEAAAPAPSRPAPAGAPPGGVAPTPLARPPARARRPPEPPPPPPGPSLWRDHVQGFVVENWYLAAGVLMVLVGASLLAYFTWDRHWALRYTIMPGLLGAFTFGLAEVGAWAERKDTAFRATGATLRGAAIALLPANFMAVALLAGDAQVNWKVVAVPLMAAIYLVAFGWGLLRWCRGVDPRLTLLALTLLALDALVMLRPLAHAFAPPLFVLPLVASGFYVGFILLAASVIRFANDVMDRELVAERRIPWFFGATLAVTFLEVFAWVHGSLGRFPPPDAYALLVILAGGLVLFVERRFLAVRGEEGRQAAESFLGYALILLGVLMGFGEPPVRILAFAAAGVVWLNQASARKEELQRWIGLTLLVLAGAAVGLLPGFPGPWLGVLGIVLALLVRGAGLFASSEKDPLLAASRGMQLVVAMLAAGVAVLAQWHFRSWPVGTALQLLACAGLFAWRAARDARLRLVHTTMVLLALALPYLGFADVLGRTLRGNTMVFGLGLLALGWIALVALRPRPLLVEARSTVLVLYGAFALGAMLLRVVVEGGFAVEHTFMDWSGPLLITVALVAATWYSRSLLPAWMGVGILVVLFPALKAAIQTSFPAVAFGTGFGSAWSALGLVLAAFRLRAWQKLEGLQGGDRLFGEAAFPLRRTDHTLFTTPLVVSALFLLAKVDTWTLMRQLDHRVALKTALALIVAGVAWTLLAAYLRERPAASLGVHLGWINLLLGLGFAHWRLAAAPRLQWPLLATGLVLQGAELAYRYVLNPRHGWVEAFLADPTRAVLRYGSLLLSVACVLGILTGTPLGDAAALMTFLAVELARHGLERRSRGDGAQLFVMGCVWLLAAVSPGSGPLPDRLRFGSTASATLWLVVGVQVLHLLLEAKPALHEKLRPLVAPAQAGVTLLAGLFAFIGLVDALERPDLSIAQQGLLLAAIALVARAQASGLFALAAASMGYVFVQAGALRGGESNLPLLGSPWRVAAFAVALAVAGRTGRAVAARWPRLLAGPFAWRGLAGPVVPWLHVPAVALALFAALRHTVVEELRGSLVQLAAPYLAAFATFLVGASASLGGVPGLGVALLSVGNVHALRLVLGDALRARGLSEVHLVALGFAASLLEGTLARLVARSRRVTAFVNRASLVVAAFILSLLSANYLAHPNLAEMAPLRFAVSGAMALAAGLYFRRAARQPGPGEEAHADLCEGLYHFGLAMAGWCFALLVPWLRRPETALVALGLPAVYFWAHAERGIRAGEPSGARYRNSAAVLGFVILALYALRPVFQMVLFPENQIRTDHYHLNAPVAIALGLLLMRLRGLGGTDWLAFYGGLSLIFGSYFGLTAWPGLSPFEDRIPAAWCAIGLAHFWTVASDRRSPLESALRRLGALDAASWSRLRVALGRTVLVSSQVAAVLGIADYPRDTYALAPLLVGAASVLVHHAALREPGFEPRTYALFAGLELAVALHADFLVPSYLPKDEVVFVLLGLWLLLLLVGEALRERLRPASIAAGSALLFAFVLGHVFYHHPCSTTGLWAVALSALLAAFVPRDAAVPTTPDERLSTLLLYAAPSWLVYFSQAPLLEEGAAGALRTWPLVATIATLFVTGVAARSYQPVWQSSVPSPPQRPRLWHHALALAGLFGAPLHAVTLTVAFLASALLQLAHYGTPFAHGELLLVLLLQAGFAWAWYREGVARRAMLPYLLAEAAALLAFALVRRQLLLTSRFWTHELDVWASLGASLILTGAKEALDRRPRELRAPVVGSILALPALAILWTIVHGLGSDVGLIVVGLNSLMFAYLGRERRDSAYNLAATSGFVAFVIIVFWSKLELRTLHAYTIPVGLGILALVQMFGRDLPPETRNRIRLVTLLGMLGSAAYYALVDDRHAIAFNLTLLLLCLAAMALGSLVRVRLYLVLGFAGIVVDLASITVKILTHLDRAARMTSVGAMVLLLGSALVGGAVYVKTHRHEIDAGLEAVRRRFDAWE